MLVDWSSNNPDVVDSFAAENDGLHLIEGVDDCPPSAVSTWEGHLQTDGQEAEARTAPEASSTARQRLEAAGVVFDDEGSVKGLPARATDTYYVVTLTWQARRR